ncbi:DUF1622 domain-containing protein [Deinococcus pimensis]|uniref:DUF1622 domain-containing protein n=1 Tax=Deinococcus pimensis TaxID=309888 RepID=UPI0004B0A58A|nr:DUF1622 domain-containing protein [Deinococcus pimensis]
MGDVWLPLARLAVELVTNVVVAGAALLAAASLLRGGDLAPDRARSRLADGLLLALSLKTAAALLRTLEVRTWTQIGLFAAVLVLRIVLKRVFAAEAARLRGSARKRQQT